MKNKFIGSDVLETAAKSLATLVKEKGKPLVFDMRTYKEVVLGFTVAPTPKDILDFFDGKEPDDKEKDQFSQNIDKFKAQQKQDSELTGQFIIALSDAFTFNEVCEICECVLTEIGHTDYPGLGECWAFMVTKVPTPEEAFVLHL
jgi:hypothetical protein